MPSTLQSLFAQFTSIAVDLRNPKNAVSRPAWPQPSPVHPGLAPAVLHVEKADADDFERHIGSRYVRTVATGFPKAAAAAARARTIEILGDDAFAAFIWNSSLSVQACPTLDPIDREHFAPVLAELPSTSRLYKVDTSALTKAETNPDYYAAPGVALLSVSASGVYRLEAIWMGGLIRPGDGDAWELAKVHMQQGITVQMTAGCHYPMHFPFDSINAITHAVLPASHPVRQLLSPHFRFSLALDDSVLHSTSTVLDSRPSHVWSAFGIHYRGILELLVAGWCGIEGNSAYPAYRFPSSPIDGLLPYDRFRRGYYDRLGLLAGRVAVENGMDEHLSRWAHHIAHWVPGFPGPVELAQPGRLAQVLTHILYGITVGHGGDHHSFGNIPFNRRPCALRVPAPVGTEAQSFRASDLATPWDLTRLWMCDELFFKEHTVVPFLTVEYAFDRPSLRGAVTEMRDALRAWDREMDVPRYIPLDRVPSSIQF